MSKSNCSNCTAKFCDAVVTDDMSNYCMSYVPPNPDDIGSISQCQLETLSDLSDTVNKLYNNLDIDSLTFNEAKLIMDCVFDELDK